MASDQSGGEGQKILLCPCGGEHIRGVDAKGMEDRRKLVHERNVEVALGVFDDLRGLRDFDGGRSVDARLDHGPIDRRDEVEAARILPGHDLEDRLEPVVFVARIDALGRIAHREVAPVDEAGMLFQERYAFVLGGAWIDR